MQYRSSLPLAAVSIAISMVLIACSSDPPELASSDTSVPSTASSSTTDPGVLSGSPQAAPTTDPAATPRTYIPRTTSTTTTTIVTTTTEPFDRVNDEIELSVDPIFEPILDELVDSTGVRIRLPAELRGPDGSRSGDGELAVATLASADADGYVVYLGAPGCNGGNACRAASFTARRISDIDGVADDGVADDEVNDLEPNGIGVPLPGGLGGRFFDATCGANCSDGSVEWDEDGVRYSVGEKLASGPRMIDWAWSAVEPDAVPPATPETCGTNPIVDDTRFANRYEIDGVNWLVVCSAQGGLEVELLDELGALRWANLGGPTLDIVLIRVDGTTRVFTVDELTPQPLIDGQTFDRAVIEDLRCGDVDEDGTIDIVDAATGRNLSSRIAISTVENPNILPACF